MQLHTSSLSVKPQSLCITTTTHWRISTAKAAHFSVKLRLGRQKFKMEAIIGGDTYTRDHQDMGNHELGGILPPPVLRAPCQIQMNYVGRH